MSKSVVLSAGTILGGEVIPSNNTTNNSVNNNSNNNSNNSNSLSHTTHRVHCLAHTSTPPRHVRVGVHQLILPRPMQCEQLIQLGIRSSDNNAGSTNTSSGGVDDDNVRNIRCTHVWSNEEVELRVEAKLWCMGMEMHSCVIGTHRQEPFGKGKEDKEEGEVEEESDNGHMDRYQNKKRSRQYVTWDDVLVFPFRWRDLTRDACITFQVIRVIHSSHIHSASSNCSNSPLSTSRDTIGGTTLHLFDEKGLFRTGKLKLLLYPDRKAMPYNIFNLRKDATPGIALDADIASRLHNEDCFGKDSTQNGYSADMEYYDDEWKAQKILAKLTHQRSDEGGYRGIRSPSRRGNQYTTKSAHSVVSASTTRTDEFSTLKSKKSSTTWLDELTVSRCKEILKKDEDSRTDHHLILDKNYKALNESTFLIIELPSFGIPIVFEESLYPLNQYGLHGASGSVTALDLSIYKHRSSYMSSILSATASLNNEKTSSIHPEQDLGHLSLGLVQILDPENEDDNPYEDKYRTLARDLLRGLVDPALKPDRFHQQKIAAIIASPSHHLSREEKDLIWRFRFSLVDNRKALTKFLLAVDWGVEAEVVQASELLGQWRQRSPIEVTDALKLLGKHVAFQTNLVRSYAIDTLNRSSDEELSLYLLQLVQALKYDDIVKGNETESKSQKKPKELSSLASFLIERASKNQELANYLYWYLRVELNNPTYGKQYQAIYVALEDKLSISPSHPDDTLDNTIQSLSKPLPISPTTVTIWEVLIAQDKYFTSIMDALVSARNEPGRKNEKVAKFQELLFNSGLDKISFAPKKSVPLPSAPDLTVEGLNPLTVTMFKSALYPALIEFQIVTQRGAISSQASSSNISPQSKHTLENGIASGDNHASSVKMIVKTGDDLRQDQLVIQIIRLMDGLLKRSTLDLCLRPYSIIATHSSPPAGLVEYVEGSLPISAVLAQNNNSILKYLQNSSPSDNTLLGVTDETMQNYVRSCAGYCVITYILGVGDRHLDNIMLLPNGQLFHIDFGFIFGRDPKPLPPPFRLTREMVEAMGGIESSEYRVFCSLACQAYNILRKHAGLILNLLHLMSDAGIEDLPSENAELVIQKVEERFRLDLTDTQAESFFSRLIYDSLNSFAPRVMEVFHQISVARR